MSSPFSIKTRHCCLILLGCFIGLNAGCGSSEPRLYPLSGKVLLNGSPLSPKEGETAYVEFSADKSAGNSSGHLPRGTIGADGSFTVTTANKPGIEAGAWLARVVYQKEPGAESKQRYASPKQLLPQKYTSFDGGLRVKAGADNPIAPDIVLESK